MPIAAVAATAVVAVPPIAATATRLARLDPFAGFEVSPLLDDSWQRLSPDQVDSTLDYWLAVLTARHGVRATAGSLLGEALIRAAILPPVAAMVLERRCPDPSADNLAARLDEAGEFTRAAVLRPTIAVLASDPAAADAQSIVVDDLTGWWAARTAATLTPLLAGVRARAPFGLPGLWGAVADEIASITLWIGQLVDRPPLQLWAHAQQLFDALAPHAPVQMARPRPLPVEHPCGDKWFRARGTCCLFYRSKVAEGRAEERYCGSCPLRDAQSRQAHLYDYLSELAGGGC